MPNLERAEKFIVVFLVAALVLGAGIVVYFRSRPPADIRVERFSVEKAGDPAAPSSATSAQVNINKASAEELVELKGIGEVLARRIVEYRASKGSFILKEDIKRVGGIGPALYEKIKDDITVE